MEFAVLDDSQMRKGSFYVYTHAFILFEEVPQVYVLKGGKEIYSNYEEKILRFIEYNLPKETMLYVCNHYSKYLSIWEKDYCLPISFAEQSIIKKIFSESDKIARQAAKKTIEDYLKDFFINL